MIELCSLRFLRAEGSSSSSEGYVGWMDHWSAITGRVPRRCGVCGCRADPTDRLCISAAEKDGIVYLLPLCSEHRTMSEGTWFQGWNVDLVLVRVVVRGSGRGAADLSSSGGRIPKKVPSQAVSAP